MRITADIIRVTQEIDVEQGVTANFLYFRLNGRVLRGLVEDEVAQAVISILMQGEALSPIMPSRDEAPAPRAPAAYEPQEPLQDLPYEEQEDGSLVTIFGGEPPPPPRALPSLRQPAPPRPTRKIQADEAGNPIMQTAGGVDHEEFVELAGERGEAPQA